MPLPQRLPSPLRGSDSSDTIEDKFTRESLFVRLPKILDELITRNPDLPSKSLDEIRALREEIAGNKPVHDRGCPLLPGKEPPDERVSSSSLPLSSSSPSPRRWGDIPWFEAENLCYWILSKALVPAGVDPFQSQKDEALRDAFTPFSRIIEGPPFKGSTPVESSSLDEMKASRLRAAILCSLWGNKADLSLTAGAAYVHSDGSASDSDHLLLINDLNAAVGLLLTTAAESIRGDRKHVVLVTDNCGLELLSDLLLVNELLSLGFPVVLHVKSLPVFVSDAMPKDVTAHIASLVEGNAGEEGRKIGLSLQKAIEEGRVVVKPFEFFCTARPFWDLFQEGPCHDEELATIRADMTSACLTIVKGDANYRRLLGDRHWPLTTRFEEVVGSYFPSSLLALRTCKSGVGIGVEADVAEATRAKDACFLVNGKFGMISLLLFEATRSKD
jgi:Damage-control phosphatase ARMT1-like domain